MTPRQTLGTYLRELREDRGLTLRDVEEATKGFVSNAYLSQLEQGKRQEPGPRYLNALAKVYGVPAETLFEKAGYTPAPSPSEIDIAYQQVLADTRFSFGTRLRGGVDDDSKRVVVQLYEKATRKTLLGKKSRKQTKRQDRPGGQK